MEQAIALATENVTSGRGGPFGAVIVKDGKVIATGVNRVTAINDPTAHAEVVAIRDACAALGSFRLDGCEVYTSCEPCPMCLAAIYWSHCHAIYLRQQRGGCGADRLRRFVSLRRDAQAARSARDSDSQHAAEKAWESFAAWEASPSRVEY